MLISFSVQNYRSIYEKQELTFLASKYSAFSDGLHRDRRLEGGILPLIALYGANAAGKTNVLRALHFLRSAITNSHNKWKPEANIPSDPHFFHQNEPTSFECLFLLNKEIYRFGFSHDENRIHSEYLYSGKSLIYRRSGGRYRLGQALEGFENVKRNTRSNSLFISAAAQNNHPLLKRIHAWFSSWDTVTEDRTMEEAFAGFLMEQENFRTFLTKAAAILSPDVVGIEPGEAQPEDIQYEEDPDLAMMMKDYAKWTRISLVHKSPDGDRTARLRLSQESKGTQSYFALAMAIFFILKRGSVLILDEADKSLHPTLLRSIVLLFQKPETNPKKAQLIFNTHDTTLLTPEVMRPDEVWFVDRDEHLNSRIYCLADFEGIRSDTKAERSYLEGRFGAVPFIEDHSKLFADVVAPARKKTSNA